MTKCWLVPFLIAGLFGDKAFADCLPAPDTPAAVIEHFHRFNQPLPEQYCAKKAAPQAPQESPKEFSQAEESPDQFRNDDGPGDGPFAQYEGDPGSGYEGYPGSGYEGYPGGGYEGDPEGGYESDPGGGYEGDPEGGYESDPGGGYESDQGGGYEDDPGGGYESDQSGSYQGYQGDLEGGYLVPPPWFLDYWKNDDKSHKGGKHRKGDGKKGKGHGKRKSACKKAHMKWNESTKTCSKRR
jgi:hypothetical protein